MQRRAIELLFNTTFRRVSALSTINRYTPCSRLHLSRLRYNVETPAQKVASVEPISDFSKYDGDTFGTLAPEKDINDKLDEMPEEEDDKVEFLLEDETGRKVRRNIGYYTRLIKKFISEKKIADAIDVLEERMLKRDKVKPDYYIYNLLINGCASVGYTQKAFKLYNKMKQAGIKRTAPTYTGLFNACANSLIPEDALIRLNNLRRQLEEQGLMLNSINYNAMIKAYARLNDVKAAFLVVDEMMTRKLPVDEGTYSFLFQACISDKEAGFRHALILWHKMRRRSVKPNKLIFNQFLRCVRDCGIGDVNETIESVKLIAGRANKHMLAAGDEVEFDSSSKPDSSTENLPESYQSNDESLLEMKENRPNLLAPVPHLGSIIELKEVNTSTDRLLLLGGFRNILREMELRDVKPDIKTFTILLDMIPSTIVAEEALIKEMKRLGVDMDIDFCNMLIKKRAYRRDHDNGRAVLELIQANFLNPDIVTFGVLALCCRTAAEAKLLIHDMKQFGYRLNVEIIGGMLKQACYTYNYEYLKFLLKLMLKLEIQPNEKVMQNLKILMSSASKHFNVKENRKKIRNDDNPANFERYQMFKDYYKQWRNEVTVYKPPHPYKQFRERFEPQNEEEEELLELQNQSNPQTKYKKSSVLDVPLKGPTKWHKPKPKVLDLKNSKERRQNMRKPQAGKFIDRDQSNKEQGTRQILKFKPFSVDGSEENQSRNSTDKSISEKAGRKMIWKRADDSAES
ncbi:pentatricopeptide repeat-containing protein 1, mitochondrial [Planococcus citri]|uniref:pentatricopeptide repeat-containing protein 1, mitochondrial n=1 Tax=Planococcus citri TaxID=170843 RepID=UPI0031F80C7B